MRYLNPFKQKTAPAMIIIWVVGLITTITAAVVQNDHSATAAALFTLVVTALFFLTGLQQEGNASKK